MATYFNNLGSSTVTGTTLQDTFFAFTYDANLAHILADSTTQSLVWATALINSDNSPYQIDLTGVTMEISTDLFLGGEKSDVLYGSNFNDTLVYNNGAISGGFGSFDSIEQFFLGGGTDLLDLTAHGAGGVDYGKDVVVNAGTGNDTVIGGAGKDSLDGDADNDLLFGYRGADTLSGGFGEDTLYGDDFGFNGISGDDLLRGNAGNDVLYGGARTDRLEGGDDNDQLFGGLGGDNLLGGAGNDTINGDDGINNGNDKLDGESGDDQLFGGNGDDENYGGTGDDTITAGDGNDFVDGSSGIDVITGGSGNDTIDGGTEIDTAIYSGNRADYSIILAQDGTLTLTDLRAGSPDGTDIVNGVEFFQFADVTVPSGDLNHSPEITSDGGGDTASIMHAENSLSVTTVTASDPDVGQTVSFSLMGGTDEEWFTINASTGELSFLPNFGNPDFENPTDANDDNSYEVIVRASDGNGGSDTQTITVTITDEPDGLSPVITSNGGGGNALVSLIENTLGIATVSADDPDGPSIQYVILGGADASLFTINSTTGELSFIGAPDFEQPLDSNGDSIYRVNVGATDGTNTDTQKFEVIITNENDNAPVITSSGGGATANINVSENSTTATTVVATDADGPPPTYEIVGGIDASVFSIDSISGLLIFNQAPDHEEPADFGQDNTYDVVVRASDGVNEDTQILSISVTNVNDNSPVITSNGGNSSANVSIVENSAAVTTVIAVDADGPAPTYSISGGADEALFSIDQGTGQLVFISAPDFENPLDAGADNSYEVIVTATDSLNSDSQTITVTVTDVSEGGKTITGTTGNNTITPTSSTVAYQTTALNDTIFALAGNDIIDGGGGADRMEGGTGNDTYTVDQYSEDGFAGNDDLIVEGAAGGTDLVKSTVSYRLGSEVEKLTLLGGAIINGTGNALNNTITGNTGANTLSGDIGNDTLSGSGGMDALNGGDGNDSMSGGTENDILFGNAGLDKLDGGTGADTLDGGTEDDTYTIDTFSNDGNSANDDIVVEAAGGGNDLVNSSVTYTLANEVEKLTLTGTALLDGYGNAVNNTINGNSGANLLGGDAGNDTMNGNAGADTLNGGVGNDSLSGGTESDELAGEGGNDKLQGGDSTDTLNGGAGDDSVNGQAGIDRLTGGTGKDVLTGGTEADTFVFAAGDTTLISTTIDSITDFQPNIDFVDLSMIAGSLSPTAYVEATIANNSYGDALSAANVQLTAGKSVVFVAGSTDGWLFWDTNGDTVIDQALLLKGMNALASFDSTSVI